MTLGDPARVVEDAEHLRVPRQRVGPERLDPVGACDGGEMFEQQGGDAPSLLVIGDRERDLRFTRLDPVVTSDGDDVGPDLRDQNHVIDVVDRREPLELNGGRARHRRKETEIDRIVAQPLVEPQQARVVVGPARSDPRRSAVGEDDVALPVRRILRHDAHANPHRRNSSFP